MRHVRLIGSLAVAVCVLAFTAAPTLAHQFVASKLAKSVGHGFEEVTEYEPAKMQEWRFGTFKILCYRAKLNGEITETESETLTTTIKYAKCGWYPQKNSLHVAANWSNSGLKIIYHANGYTETVGNGEGETLEFKKAVILETAAYIKINASKLCKIVIPEQTVPIAAIKNPEAEYSAAVYSNNEVAASNLKYFPSGFQKRIVIANEFKKLKFVYSGEETQCAEALEFAKEQKEGVTGVYKGSVEPYIQYGDLSFE
jgi:hypothetical protein